MLCDRAARREYGFRCSRHRDQRIPAPIGYDESDGAPILAAERRNDMLWITCPWCGAPHSHGAVPLGSPVGTGDGGRASHCNPSELPNYESRRYVLKEVVPS
jgi:hypothetical protein